MPSESKDPHRTDVRSLTMRTFWPLLHKKKRLRVVAQAALLETDD